MGTDPKAWVSSPVPGLRKDTDADKILSIAWRSSTQRRNRRRHPGL